MAEADAAGPPHVGSVALMRSMSFLNIPSSVLCAKHIKTKARLHQPALWRGGNHLVGCGG